MKSETRVYGDGRIYLRGKTWWIQYYSRGRKVRESAATNDEKKARKRLRKRLGEVAAGVYVDARNLRYEDLRDAYYLDYATNRRKSLEYDAAGRPYADAARRLDSFFEGYRGSEITTDQIKRYQKDQQKKGLDNASINRSVSALRRMFNLAVEEEKLRNVPYFPMLPENAPRKGFFEKKDYEALLAELPDYGRLPLALGFFTGMRSGEIFGLRWEQVDFMANEITLHAGETKNDEGRVVPVVPQLRALLVERYAERRKEFPFVCWRLDKRGNVAKIDGFRKAWYSACVRAGLGKKEPKINRETGNPELANPRPDRLRAKSKEKMIYVGKTLHDLRRSAVRQMVRAGVPEKVAMGISGHKTRSVFDRYNIVSGSDLAKAAEKVSEFYERQEVGHNSGTIDVPGGRVQ